MHRNLDLEARLATLPDEAHVIDFGGWRKAHPRADFIADLLPYETRGRQPGQPAPVPGERFTKERWYQIDFQVPGARLPVPDNYFDFGLCGHTIEDLANPEPLLREMVRTCRAGYIACPSRLVEQSVGVADRMSSREGYEHHHWIVEVRDGAAGQAVLKLFAKRDSVGSPIPLRHYERQTAGCGGAVFETQLLWEARLEYEMVRGAACAEAARRFAALQLGGGLARGWARATDAAIRAARRFKYRRNTDWRSSNLDEWRQVLAWSRPYSTITLPEE